jgi:diaminopimelate decarboxylase
MAAMLELFPETAAVEDGELEIGGIRLSALVSEYGTPLVVYDEATLLGSVRAYRAAAPDAFVVYGVKAFPNTEVLRLLAGEGLGADVSTLGELQLALRAGMPGDKLVVHGNNKSDEELAAAARAEAAYVVVDALDEVERSAAADVSRILVRVNPGVEADTHPAIRTAHEGSKFGLPPDQALEALTRAREAGLEAAGLHVHIGSQLMDARAGLATVDWVGEFADRCRRELEWTPGVVNLGGGLGIQYVEGETPPTIESFVGELVGRLADVWADRGLPLPRLVLEPGRSLVGRAGVTVYEVGVVKQVTADTTYVAVDGGMSDNPRPQLYDAAYTGLLANRAEEQAAGSYVVCGKHCESGDVMIRDLALPAPRRGDLLAVPATGGYTLAMASNYNVVPRPAAVLVAGGEARLIRKRETIDDLLELEVL